MRCKTQAPLGGVSPAPRSGKDRAALLSCRTLLDPEARHQDDRNALLERSQRRGTMGDRCVSRQAARNEPAEIYAPGDGRAWPMATIIINTV